ncbi:MAG: hypothetical protein E7174_04600 [Firmicutes bacterium]|nr:hypothetical protein [Bacillota bacterium]
MKKYVDFDGVIFDSEIWLFDEEYRNLNIKNEFDKIKYIQNKNWDEILMKSEIINDAINILKELRDVVILTKIHSMENEGVAKIKLLRSLEIKNEIILSPYTLKKSEVVDPRGNILIDDTIHNLDDWKQYGGIPIYFNKNNCDVDGWGNVNKNYTKVNSLDYLKYMR